jgi:hypothetical protein
MKSICSILILMIAVHAQCGVQCLGADLNITSHKAASTAEQPPCHQHSENPQTVPSDQDSSRHDHENSGPCGQAQSIESRIGPISKCVLHCIVIESVTSHVSLDHFAIRIPAIIDADGLFASEFPTHTSVLRI